MILHVDSALYLLISSFICCSSKWQSWYLRISCKFLGSWYFGKYLYALLLHFDVCLILSVPLSTSCFICIFGATFFNVIVCLNMLYTDLNVLVLIDKTLYLDDFLFIFSNWIPVIILVQAQLLARNDEEACIDDDDAQTSEFSGSGIASNGDNPMRADDNDDEMRNILTDMFIDNARLRKQVNSVIRCALNTVIKPEREESNEVSSRKTVLNRFLERWVGHMCRCSN